MSSALQMWFKARQYLEKMGTVILVASVFRHWDIFRRYLDWMKAEEQEIYEDFLAEKVSKRSQTSRTHRSISKTWYSRSTLT